MAKASRVANGKGKQGGKWKRKRSGKRHRGHIAHARANQEAERLKLSALTRANTFAAQDPDGSRAEDGSATHRRVVAEALEDILRRELERINREQQELLDRPPRGSTEQQVEEDLWTSRCWSTYSQRRSGLLTKRSKNGKHGMSEHRKDELTMAHVHDQDSLSRSCLLSFIGSGIRLDCHSFLSFNEMWTLLLITCFCDDD